MVHYIIDFGSQPKCEKRLHDLPFRAHDDMVNDLNEQVDKPVEDLLLPLPEDRR